MAQQNVTLNKTYSTLIQPDLIKRSVRVRDNWFNNGDVAPFSALLRGRGRVTTETNQTFEWLEKRPNKIMFEVAPASVGATTLTVNTTADVASFLSVGSIIKVLKTKEQLVVTAVNGKAITVTRGYGDDGAGAAAEITADNPAGTHAQVLNLSRAFPEGSYAPEGTVFISTQNKNYSQIFRDTVDITRNDLKSPRYGDNGSQSGDLRKRRRTEVFKTHQMGIEHQMLFGVPKKDLTGAKPLYVTGGLTHFIKSNVRSITDPADFGPGAIDQIMGLMSAYGATGDKILMAGNGFLNRLNANAISVFGGGAGKSFSDYGVTMKNISTSYGDLKIIFNPVLSAAYPNMGIFVDLSNVWLHTIQDTTLETNIQISGYDGVIDTYLTDCGLEVSNEDQHAILTLDW